MAAWLQWIESLPVSVWVRESSSIFAYSGILFLHTLGLGILVGANVALALSVLRRENEPGVAALTALYPYMWAGFWINAGSGSLLLIADAATKLINPVFYIKMACVGLAVWNMTRMKTITGRLQGRDAALSRRARTAALLSLLLWAGAITAGRLMAYLGPVSGLQK